MNRFLYTLLLYLVTPLVFLKLLWRSRRAPAYRRRWGERLGFVAPLPRDKPVIWVHAVSVGETIASAPLVKALIQAYPNHRCLVTTMTPTGSQQVRAIHGETVVHVYAPYDLPCVLQRFFKRAQPALAIIVETELWPNTLAGCYRRNIPVVVANARLSERSANGYRRLGGLTRTLMGRLSVVACQNNEDGQRFIALGLPADRLVVTGSVKFDITLSQKLRDQARQIRQQWVQSLGQGTRVLLAASTHEGEEPMVLQAFASLRVDYPDLLLVLVPRHPERVEAVQRLACQKGLAVARHSQGTRLLPGTAVVLVDTMGELLKLYGSADMAFVGGSLVARGGHNVLEPAAWGLPVLSGPHVFNFKAICQSLEEAGGLVRVDNSEQLAAGVRRLLDDPQALAQAGQHSRSFIARNRGAQERLLAVIARVIAPSVADL